MVSANFPIPLHEAWDGYADPPKPQTPVPDDAHYFDNARKALRLAREKDDRFIGTCKDCIYNRPSWIPNSMGRCVNPVVQEVVYAELDPERQGMIELCHQQRKTSSQYGIVVCGPNGVLFEERDPNWLRRFFVNLFRRS